MNTVKHTKKIRVEHSIEMFGPITARDIGDFIFQVETIYERVKGKKPQSDDAYMVIPTDEGIKAVFTTRESLSKVPEARVEQN